jgi:hypothetical protein
MFRPFYRCQGRRQWICGLCLREDYGNFNSLPLPFEGKSVHIQYYKARYELMSLANLAQQKYASLKS